MKSELLKYRVLIQYLENGTERLHDLATSETIHDKYKTAKKFALKTIQGIQVAGKKVVKATIEPVLLEESLIQEN